MTNVVSPTPSNVFALTVNSVQHYTDRLFLFKTERPTEFRFRSGEFIMIGLPPEIQAPNDEKPKTVWRAYSIASPSWEEQLEFFSIKVPDGPLTEQLQKIKVGDKIWMRKKPTGTLVHDALIGGKRLFLFSTGTGIAPFASVIRDPETYEKFEQVVLIQTCREKTELQYGKDLIEEIKNHEFLGEMTHGKLLYYATTTRDGATGKGDIIGRCTDLVRSGKLFEDLGIDPIDKKTSRVMICGSMAMLKDTEQICIDAGLVEGSNAQPGEYVIERAFVD